MLTLSIGGGLIAPAPARPAVVDVSMFKNGYSVVTREVSARDSGEYLVQPVPQGSLGTLWFSASDGVRLDEVVNTSVQENTTQPIGSMTEMMRRNVGTVVRIGIRDGDALRARLSK